MPPRNGSSVAVWVAATLATVAILAPPALADTRQEATAKATLKRARAEFAAANYGIGSSLLQEALKACGQTKCPPPTRAALLLGLGAMQFKKGARDDAIRAFFDAATLQPGISLDPGFDSPDLRAAFTVATQRAKDPSGNSRGATPREELGHTPPAEQIVDTPLPLYVDATSDAVVRVAVEYKTESSSAWKTLDMARADTGWGALIPCGDVTRGALRYYIQGLDEDNTPIATSGDPRHPHTVRVSDTISGEAPHLPGEPPPGSCSQPVLCARGLGGCHKDAELAELPVSQGTTRAPDIGGATQRHSFKRVWLGVGGELEFMRLPTTNDACALDPTTGLPSNGAGLYCTTPSGSDFPARGSALENAGLCTAAQVGSGLCPTDSGGAVHGGIVRGNARVIGSLDVALTANLLVGARVGATLFPYPGQAAVNDGRTLGSRLYGELRWTWVMGGDGIASPGLKPVLLLGGGVAAFGAHIPSSVAFCPAALPAPVGKPCQVPLYTGAVNVWQTSGPAFGTFGAGLRWAATESFALTVAARLNVSIRGGGPEVIPTLGPEVAAQLGF